MNKVIRTNKISFASLQALLAKGYVVIIVA